MNQPETHAAAPEPPNYEGRARYLADLFKTQQSNAEAYDRALLTLSSATLGVSMTFIKDVVQIEQAVLLWLLILAWSLLIGTIVLSIAGYMFAAWNSDWLAQHADDFFIKRTLSLGGEARRIVKREGFLNTAAGIVFLLGIACLAVFVSLNTLREASMKQHQQQGAPEAGSKVDRTMPSPPFDQYDKPTTTPPPQKPQQSQQGDAAQQSQTEGAPEAAK